MVWVETMASPPAAGGVNHAMLLTVARESWTWVLFLFLIARGGEGGAWCLASRRSFLLFVAGDFSSLACFVHMSNSFNSTLVPCCGCLCRGMFVYVCVLFFSLSLSYFCSCYPFFFQYVMPTVLLLYLLAVACAGLCVCFFFLLAFLFLLCTYVQQF